MERREKGGVTRLLLIHLTLYLTLTVTLTLTPTLTVTLNLVLLEGSSTDANVLAVADLGERDGGQ